MCIVIKADKKINKAGQKVYEVTYIDALAKDKLPDEYLRKHPNVYLYNSDLWSGGYPHLCVGYEYTESEWNTKIAYAKQAGERLKKINDKLRELEKEWNGKVVIKI